MNSKSSSCEATHLNKVSLERARLGMPKDYVIKNISNFFKVMGDNTRIRILWALDEREMCVCGLAELLNMTKSAISHQLRTLREARLVKFRKDGKNVYYSLDDEHIRDIFETAIEHIGEHIE